MNTGRRRLLPRGAPEGPVASAASGSSHRGHSSLKPLFNDGRSPSQTRAQGPLAGPAKPRTHCGQKQERLAVLTAATATPCRPRAGAGRTVHCWSGRLGKAAGAAGLVPQHWGSRSPPVAVIWYPGAVCAFEAHAGVFKGSHHPAVHPPEQRRCTSRCPLLFAVGSLTRLLDSPFTVDKPPGRNQLTGPGGAAPTGSSSGGRQSCTRKEKPPPSSPQKSRTIYFSGR